MVVTDLLRKEQKSGFVGKTRSGELDPIMNIKQNKEGGFLSLYPLL